MAFITLLAFFLGANASAQTGGQPMTVYGSGTASRLSGTVTCAATTFNLDSGTLFVDCDGNSVSIPTLSVSSLTNSGGSTFGDAATDQTNSRGVFTQRAASMTLVGAGAYLAPEMGVNRELTLVGTSSMTVGGAMLVEGNSTLGNAAGDYADVVGVGVFRTSWTLLNAGVQKAGVDASGNAVFVASMTAGEGRFYAGTNQPVLIQPCDTATYNCLTINGNTTDAGMTGFSGGGDDILYYHSTDRHIWYTDGVNKRAELTNGGLFGIGNIIPTALFSVNNAATIDASGNLVAVGSGTFNGNGVMQVAPSTQTIAATNTVAADACGGFKSISSAGAVTTSTTDTFTAPAGTNQGCIMHVCNVGGNNITLDWNANFRASGGADVVLTPNDCVIVGSNGSIWYQLGGLVAND